MARIRSIKPEFWDDRKLARSCTRDARMLYVGMWNQSDEHSRLNGDTFWLKGRIFPYDDDVSVGVIGALLDELEAAERIQRYEVDGDPFIYLPKLDKHQRLETTKVDSRLPAPPAQTDPRTDSDTDAHQSEPRADESAPDADESALLYVAGSRGQGAGSKELVVPRAEPRGHRIPDEWTPDAALIDDMRREGIPDDLARRELPKFRDYWASQPGAKGRKTDWRGVWRNWLRKAIENYTGPTSNGAGRATAKAQGWMDLSDGASA